MRSFNMGRFSNDDPWFKVGTVDVTTTIFVVGLGIIFMFVWALEGAGGPIGSALSFTPDQVQGGQIWRLVTWPIPNLPEIWTLLLFAIFFMLGSQLEAAMGRKVFAGYLLAIVVVPVVIMTVVELLTGLNGGAVGLRLAEMGVLVGFAARMPKAMFWPGIPAWIIAGVIVMLELLRDTGLRQSFHVLLVLITVGVALLGIRALGFAEESPWIPKLPLPVASGGAPSSGGGRAKKSTSKRRRRKGSHLSVAPPAPAVGIRRELTKLEEAEMDGILEQVSEHGLKSLTDEQRQRLEQHSQRLRRRGDRDL